MRWDKKIKAKPHSLTYIAVILPTVERQVNHCWRLRFPQSHYSIKKAGAALGFGTENVILLSTDER